MINFIRPSHNSLRRLKMKNTKRRVWTHPKVKGKFRGTTRTVNLAKVRKSGAMVETTFILVPMDEVKKGDAYQKKAFSYESWQAAVKDNWSRK